MAVAYTIKMLIERIRRHMANGFPSDETTLSSNEVLLHISQALSFNMVGQVYAGAKVEGLLDIAEGYLTTYSLSLTKEESTGYWYGDLPHPPVSLPIHTAIKELYFASSVDGQSDPIFLIKSRRVAFRRYLPLPNGNRAWVNGKTLYIASSNGNPFTGKTLYVRMAKSRVTDITEDLNIPDDAIEMIFTSVTKKLAERFNIPQDVVKDDVSAGNKQG